MRGHYVCPNCANPVMRGALCVCSRSIHTIVGGAETSAAQPTAASPPWSELIFRVLNWRKRSGSRVGTSVQRVARMPIERDVIASMRVSRSDSSLDMLCAYIVLPILGLLTAISGVFLILSSVVPILDLMFNIIHYTGL
jgi:hypothetical protein